MFRRLILTPLLLSMLSGFAGAQGVKLYQQNEAVNPTEVARILAGEPAQAEAPIRTRSIRLLDEAPRAAAAPAVAAPAPAAAQGADTAAGLEPRLAAALAAARSDVAAAAARPQPTAKPSAAALALPVQFKFDSAEILPAAREQLDALAEGIRLLPEGKRVVIEGHTDAVGSDAYNEVLSMKRAQAVKQYLVSNHEIDGARLRAVGFGDYVPLPGLKPTAAEQRRVQFRGE